MEIIFILIIATYGVVHLLSYFWSFRIVDTKPIVYVGEGWLKGIVSLLIFQLLGIGALNLVFKNGSWWFWTLIAAALSQLIVVSSWEQLKYFSIINVAIIIVSLVGYKFWSFEKKYNDDVQLSIERTSQLPVEIFEEGDLVGLPLLVQRYLRTSGVIGKPKVYNMKVRFKGQMRNKETDWFDFTSEQYNFFDLPQRNFFMKAKVKNIRTHGYHAFESGKATMDIRALSTIPLVSTSGEKLDIAETVTLFNDMCILAPASLIDRRITWETIDDRSVLATFTNEGITIQAKLYINEVGQLINFISEDRYELTEDKKLRFSTPLSEYKNVNGYRLPTKGKATWHYLDGPFAYGIFHLESIEYNVKLNQYKT